MNQPNPEYPLTSNISNIDSTEPIEFVKLKIIYKLRTYAIFVETEIKTRVEDNKYINTYESDGEIYPNLSTKKIRDKIQEIRDKEFELYSDKYLSDIFIGLLSFGIII